MLCTVALGLPQDLLLAGLEGPCAPPAQITQGEMRILITFGTCAPWLLIMHEDVRWDGIALSEITVSQSAPRNSSLAQ